MYSDIQSLKHEAKLVGEYLLKEGRNSRLFLFMQGSDRLALLLLSAMRDTVRMEFFMSREIGRIWRMRRTLRKSVSRV